MNWVHPATLWGMAIIAVVVAASVLTGRRIRLHLHSIGGNSVEWQVRSFLRDFTMAGFLALVVLAAAEPRSGRKPVSGEQSGLDIAVAFDVSRSMLTRDISPSRLERGITALGQITRSSHDSRFSLTPFKGDAVPLVPMTEDRVILDLWIERLGPGLSTAGGTDLESALRAASESFPGGVGRGQVLLIISDGESLTGRADRVTRKLTERGITVYVLLTGSSEGGPIPLGNGEYLKDSSGRPVVSRADGTVLRRLADETGGSFHDLSRPGAVSELIAAIQGNRELVENRGIRFTAAYRYRIFLVPALLFAFFNLLVRIFPWRRK